jgi:heat shock protein HslJ
MRASIAVLALLAVVGCAITSREATTNLPGTSWLLVDLDGAEPVGETRPHLTFDAEGGVSGSTGCNTFSGEVAIAGPSLTIGSLATTDMACLDPEVAAQEVAFLAALEAVTGYTIDDEGRLVLQGAAPLTFEVGAEAE